MAQTQAQSAAKQRIRELQQVVQQQMVSSGRQTPTAVCRTPGCQALPQQVTEVATIAQRAGRPLTATLSAPLTSGALSSFEEQLGADLAAMNDLSDMTSQRLQMEMDREAKFVAARSNILKTIATTQDALVQNLK